MERNTSPLAGLRWGRALIAAFVAELALVVFTKVVEATVADPRALFSVVVAPLVFVVFIPAGYWTARGAGRAALLNGALPGLYGILLYVLLTLTRSGLAEDFDLASNLRPTYLLAHGLKVVGGVIGAWLVARRVPAAQ